MFSYEIIHFNEIDLKMSIEEWVYWAAYYPASIQYCSDEQLTYTKKIAREEYLGLKHAYMPDYLIEPCGKSVRKVYYSRKYKGMLIDKQKRKKRELKLIKNINCKTLEYKDI